MNFHRYPVGKERCREKELEYNISEDVIKSFGSELLQQNKISAVELIFQHNVELYPNSYNVYHSYGECLLISGKQKEGTVAYQKCLELNPGNTNAKNIILN